MKSIENYRGRLRPHLPFILKSLHAGCRSTAISAELEAMHRLHHGATLHAIYRIRKLCGIAGDERPDNRARNAAMAADYRKPGVSLRKLGEQYGLTPQGVRVALLAAKREAERQQADAEAAASRRA